MDASKTMQVIRDTEAKLSHLFTPEEVADTIRYTERKCELNGKDEEYFYILLENELRDLLTRTYINLIGELNRERRNERCVASAT